MQLSKTITPVLNDSDCNQFFTLQSFSFTILFITSAALLLNARHFYMRNAIKHKSI